MMVATKASLAGYEVPGTFEAVRAGALFVSGLQPSGSPSPGQVRRAVAATLQRLGVRGCAARVAGEFGDHPDTAVARMSWALATINTVWVARDDAWGAGITGTERADWLQREAS